MRTDVCVVENLVKVGWFAEVDGGRFFPGNCGGT